MLAQEAKGGGDAASPTTGLTSLLLPVLAAFALYYFMFMRVDRKRQASHKARLDALKKNDRVVTIGGIYGVVMNVQRDQDEVTLKIDEANNTRIRVTFGSIGRVVGDEPPGDKQE